jgi:isoleucyl-tRNA synthetase
VTVALDITISDELYAEGIARDFVNRVQNIRKEQNFDVVDTIDIQIENKNEITNALLKNSDYICSETLAKSLTVSENIAHTALELDLSEGVTIKAIITNRDKTNL